MSPVVLVRFIVKSGQEARVESVLRKMVVNTRQEPGCRRYDLFEVSAGSAGKNFYLIENYADDAAVQAHRDTLHYKEYRASIMDLLAQPIEVTLLQALDVRGT
jgi:quinol monooxygenase YgiN